jgi:hypothetical protein
MLGARPLDLFAAGLAALAAALGWLAGSGPLVALVGLLLLGAMLVRAQLAATATASLVAPLLVVIGVAAQSGDGFVLALGAVALLASAAIVRLGSAGATHPPDAIVAARAVLALAAYAAALLLAFFAVLFSI